MQLNFSSDLRDFKYASTIITDLQNLLKGQKFKLNNYCVR